MDKKRKDGYVTGSIFLLIFIFFFVVAVNTGWNTSGQIFGGFSAFFGFLGFGSLLKPDSIGAVALQILENLGKSEEEGSDSHNKQIQKESAGGVQVMATHGAKVNINVPSAKKKKPQNTSDEEKDSSQRNNCCKSF